MKAYILSILLCLLFIFSFHACKDDMLGEKPPFELELPAHFPPILHPEGNELTQERVDLGKMLFYEKALSLDSSISCATCHPQAKAFADNEAVSIGIQNRLGFRNVPVLGNVAYHPYFFREGGSPSLEAQVLGPICNFDEMGFNARELADRLKLDSTYQQLARKAYERPMDLWVITRALSAFERTLITGDSPWDHFIQGDSSALSSSEKRGWDLFQSERLACTQCHSGIDFSDYSFQNNGLYSQYEDKGRYRASFDTADIGKFKVFSLRNVELTGPYMHDGSLTSLEEVIEHYNSGGKQPANQSKLIKPLGLTETEKTDLIAFLKALTDDTFLQNPAFKE